MNIEFLVICYFVSLFIDWVFQWNWQAVNKSKWGKDDKKFKSFVAVSTHAFVYGTLTTFITYILLILAGASFKLEFVKPTYYILVLSHLFIDTRLPVKAIMWFKGIKKEQINDYQNYGFMHIGLDHRLHELVILTLAFFV
jgi:hypothetical protein